MFFATATVERPETELQREVWTFVLMDGAVLLDRWQRQERKTTRHKWRAHKARWSRTKLDNADRYNKTPRPSPPPDVVDEAVKAIRETIVFKEGKE